MADISKPGGGSSISEAARSILLAEALGDLQRLQQSVDAVQATFKTMLADAAQQEAKQKHWSAVLDSKVRALELLDVQGVSDKRFELHATSFLRGLIGEVRKLVDTEFKTRPRANDLQRLIACALIFFSIGCAIGLAWR